MQELIEKTLKDDPEISRVMLGRRLELIESMIDELETLRVDVAKDLTKRIKCIHFSDKKTKGEFTVTGCNVMRMRGEPVFGEKVQEPVDYFIVFERNHWANGRRYDTKDWDVTPIFE